MAYDFILCMAWLDCPLNGGDKGVVSARGFKYFNLIADGYEIALFCIWVFQFNVDDHP